MNNTQKHVAAAMAMLFMACAPLCEVFAGDEGLGLRVVCIDAGHGGKDPGCISSDKKTYESRINLDIAKRLRAKILSEMPGVKVVMTRSTDVFVTLAGRAEIANKKEADLFISIHVNDAKSKSANGYSVHVLGPSSKKDRDLLADNMDVCRRENSVILLEDDYTITYQGFDPNDTKSSIFFSLLRNSNLEWSLLFAQDVEQAFSSGPMRSSRGVWQDPFCVLWKTAMPAVLVEVGFMSNAKDLATLRTEAGRDKIADGLVDALKVFKKRYDESLHVEKAEEDVAKTAPRDTVCYGIQVLASSKEMKASDPFFKGHAPTVIKAGKLNKYIICVTPDKERARETFSKLGQSFSGSFLVEIRGDEASVLR